MFLCLMRLNLDDPDWHILTKRIFPSSCGSATCDEPHKISSLFADESHVNRSNSFILRKSNRRTVLSSDEEIIWFSL